MSFDREKINNSPEVIIMDDRSFDYVKRREYDPISIFKGKGLFLRLGPKELLHPEIDFHRNLLKNGFPAPEIIEEGEFNGQYYYLETSLGDESFADLFQQDIKKEGKISEQHFSDFLNVSKQFAQAQINVASFDRDEEGFYLGTYMDLIQGELPDLKPEILRAFNKVKQNTRGFPYVLTHGDFNAFNIFEKGVIDFSNAFHAPAGYDLVSNTHHTYFFPKGGDYEIARLYEFSAKQLKLYYDNIDSIYQSANLPKLSDYLDDFIFCRSIWATVKMQHYQKLQHYRYEKFKKIANQYLAEERITEIIN